MPKYSYKQWMNGEFMLNTCEAFYPKGKKIVSIDWGSVTFLDVPKIKLKQKELFEMETSNLLKNWKEIFLNKLNDYAVKSKYVENELHDFRKIMSIREDDRVNDNISILIRNLLNHKTTLFEEQHLDEIRMYIHDVILVDKKRTYDFMHSQKFKFKQKKRIKSEVYAQVCWDYYRWLKEFHLKIMVAKEKAELKKSNQHEFQHRQIAIACFAAGIKLTVEEAIRLLATYSTCKSYTKLISCKYYQPSFLTTPKNSNRSKTVHMTNMARAIELLKLMREDKAVEKLTGYINEFKHNSGIE